MISWNRVLMILITIIDSMIKITYFFARYYDKSNELTVYFHGRP